MTRFSFSSRKEPEFMNHRLVRCRTCDLVFVDRPPDQDVLAEAYHVAAYDSAEEAEDAAATYFAALASTLRQHPEWRAALEIGAGTGAFLDHLAAAGFTTVVGIEPSTAAIAAAPTRRHDWLRPTIFRESDFAPGSFDLVCCFMTMEHVRDPGELCRAVMQLLRPGGAFVIVTHDHRSLINRLLGRRSPIIDIEHMQLFSLRSIGVLYRRAGFRRVSTRRLVNRYSTSYWWRLMPVPTTVRRWGEATLNALHIDQRKIAIDVGNVSSIGYKDA